MSKPLTLEEAAKRAGSKFTPDAEMAQANPFGPEVEIGGKSPLQDIADMFTVLPQAMLLEHADELLEKFSPQMAKDYREAVRLAKERSPGITTVTELFSPDILTLLGGAGYIRKMGRIGEVLKNVSKYIGTGKGIKGSMAQDAITSVAVQHGTGGDFDALNTGLSVAGGQILRSVPRLFTGNPTEVRSNYVGLTKQKKLIGPKMKGDITSEEIMTEMIENMDLGHNLFSVGPSKFGKDLKFTPTSYKTYNELKSKVVTPTEKQLLTRTNQAKKAIWKEIEEIEARSPKKVFTEDDFIKENYFELQEEVATLSGKEENKAAEVLRDFTYSLLGGHKKTEIKNILKAKRNLYKRLDYLKENEKSFLIPLRKKMAGVLNNMVSHTIGNEATVARYRLLNRKYGEFSEMHNSIKNKNLLTGLEDKIDFSPSFAGTSVNFGIMSILQAYLKRIRTGLSQGASTLEKNDLLKSRVQTPIRKGMADLLNNQRELDEDERQQQLEEQEGEDTSMLNFQSPVPEPPKKNFNPMSPVERMELNMPEMLIEARLPRTTEGLTQNSKMFKYKIAQNAESIVRDNMAKMGRDPEMEDPEDIKQAATTLYKNVEDILENKPDDIPSMLPVWIQEHPGMFERDRYGRIDGVVPASQQALVMEEIRKNPSISNMERIKQLDLLNRSGEYKDMEKAK